MDQRKQKMKIPYASATSDMRAREETRKILSRLGCEILRHESQFTDSTQVPVALKKNLFTKKDLMVGGERMFSRVSRGAPGGSHKYIRRENIYLFREK
jgi:hypothetical protein